MREASRVGSAVWARGCMVGHLEEPQDLWLLLLQRRSVGGSWHDVFVCQFASGRGGAFQLLMPFFVARGECNGRV